MRSSNRQKENTVQVCAQQCVWSLKTVGVFLLKSENLVDCTENTQGSIFFVVFMNFD